MPRAHRLIKCFPKMSVLCPPLPPTFAQVSPQLLTILCVSSGLPLLPFPWDVHFCIGNESPFIQSTGFNCSVLKLVRFPVIFFLWKFVHISVLHIIFRCLRIFIMSFVVNKDGYCSSLDSLLLFQGTFSSVRLEKYIFLFKIAVDENTLFFWSYCKTL